MSRYLGVLVLFFSFIFGGYLSDSSIDVTGLVQSKCRIAGIAQVDNKDKGKKFNYTIAEEACEALGLQIATQEQMEKARGYGFETCSYGWIFEKVGAIPRIQNNENCGQNKTGVRTWKKDLSWAFPSAYCFNVSDVRINSCKPGLMVTEPPSTVVVLTSGSTKRSTSLKTETETVATLPASTLIPTTRARTTQAKTTHVRTTQAKTTHVMTTQAKTTHVMTTEEEAPTPSLYTTLITTVRTPQQPTTLQTTPEEDTEPPRKQENQMLQKHERLVFGGLPTTLLILALLFFLAAVVLAVCYVKKYKTHLFFSTNKQKKESVETKVFKDKSGAENMKEEERFTNVQESPRKLTGNSIEAEV